MATVTLKGTAFHTYGDLPSVGTSAPSFSLVKTDLSETTLNEFAGKNVILNIFPSLDTPTCAMSVRRFNADASAKPNTSVLCISMDLPFAAARFCSTEGLARVIPASAFRAAEFGRQYGVLLTDGPLAGLLARAVLVISESGKVIHTELVPEIVNEPNYDAALSALDK